MTVSLLFTFGVSPDERVGGKLLIGWIDMEVGDGQGQGVVAAAANGPFPVEAGFHVEIADANSC
jgi:hypothetical protein